MRRPKRLGQGLLLILVTINSPVGALWLREQSRPTSGTLSSNRLLYEDEYDFYSVHRHVWRKLRELFGLSDEEVQSLIFERHDFPPENIEVTTSPAPNQGAPSLSPSPNVSPGLPTTSDAPSSGSVDTNAPSIPTVSKAPSSGGNSESPAATRPTGGRPTVSKAPSLDTSVPSAFGGPTTSLLPTASTSPAIGTTVPSIGGPTTVAPSATAVPSLAAGPTGLPVPTVSRAPSAGTFGPSLAAGPTAVPVPTLSSAPTLSTGTVVPTGPQTVEEFLTATLTDDGTISVDGTPQNQALIALESNFPDLSPNNGPEERQLIQEIYALNTLFFSTNGTNWAEVTGWTGPDPVCTPWVGITCGSAPETVISIDLTGLDLIGTIPSEIRGLSSLGT